MSRYLKLGALAGAMGGVALAVFLLAVGESSIEDAIGRERARPGAHHEMFSRAVQHIGGGIRAVIFGVAPGLAFAVGVWPLSRALGMGCAGVKSSLQGSTVSKADGGGPGLVSGVMAEAGKVVLEGWWQDGTSAVAEKLLDLVEMGGKFEGDKGKDSRE